MKGNVSGYVCNHGSPSFGRKLQTKKRMMYSPGGPYIMVAPVVNVMGCRWPTDGCFYIWRALFQNAINAKKKKWICHVILLCTEPIHCSINVSCQIAIFPLFKMYLTLLTSQRGALATDARSCSLWRSLLVRPPPVPKTRVWDPLGVMVRTRGDLTIIV